MHVLLTGSSGWLGRFLAPRLRAAGHRVTGLDVAPGRDTAIVGSVADRATVERAFAKGIEAVILSPTFGDFNEDLRLLGLAALRAAIRVQIAPQDVARFMEHAA